MILNGFGNGCPGVLGLTKQQKAPAASKWVLQLLTARLTEPCKASTHCSFWQLAMTTQDNERRSLGPLQIRSLSRKSNVRWGQPNLLQRWKKGTDVAGFRQLETLKIPRSKLPHSPFSTFIS